LKPAIKIRQSTPPLKLLRPKDREEKINYQDKSDEDAYDIGHFLELFTGAGIKIAEPEKNDRD
jgi:hypothetical protein